MFFHCQPEGVSYRVLSVEPAARRAGLQGIVAWSSRHTRSRRIFHLMRRIAPAGKTGVFPLLPASRQRIAAMAARRRKSALVAIALREGDIGRKACPGPRGRDPSPVRIPPSPYGCGISMVQRMVPCRFPDARPARPLLAPPGFDRAALLPPPSRTESPEHQQQHIRLLYLAYWCMAASGRQYI